MLLEKHQCSVLMINLTNKHHNLVKIKIIKSMRYKKISNHQYNNGNNSLIKKKRVNIFDYFIFKK